MTVDNLEVFHHDSPVIRTDPEPEGWDARVSSVRELEDLKPRFHHDLPFPERVVYDVEEALLGLRGMSTPDYVYFYKSGWVSFRDGGENKWVHYDETIDEVKVFGRMAFCSPPGCCSY